MASIEWHWWQLSMWAVLRKEPLPQSVVADVANIVGVSEFWQTPAIHLTHRSLLEGETTIKRYGATVYLFAKELFQVPDGAGGLQQVEAWLLKQCEDEYVGNDSACDKNDLPLRIARCVSTDIFPDKNGDATENEQIAAANITALLAKAGITPQQFRDYPLANPPYAR
jgi:hypothetical protein